MLLLFNILDLFLSSWILIQKTPESGSETLLSLIEPTVPWLLINSL